MIGEIMMNYFNRKEKKKSNLFETFKIVEFLFMVNIFFIFLPEMEIYCQDRFQKLILMSNWIILLIK